MNEAKPFVIDKRLVWEAYHKVKENKGSAGIDKEDSYGYRPGKGAHQAVAKARERCYVNPWVLDMDISKFFYTIKHVSQALLPLGRSSSMMALPNILARSLTELVE